MTHIILYAQYNSILINDHPLAHEVSLRVLHRSGKKNHLNFHTIRLSYINSFSHLFPSNRTIYILQYNKWIRRAYQYTFSHLWRTTTKIRMVFSAFCCFFFLIFPYHRRNNINLVTWLSFASCYDDVPFCFVAKRVAKWTMASDSASTLNGTSNPVSRMMSTMVSIPISWQYEAFCFPLYIVRAKFRYDRTKARVTKRGKQNGTQEAKLNKKKKKYQS